MRRALEHRQRADARPKGDAEKATKNATGQRSGWPIGSYTMIEPSNREPAVGIEPTTARLRIGCSTTELRWRVELLLVGHALARTRTATPFGTTPSRWRVYQFHHQGLTTGNREVGTGNRVVGLEKTTVPSSQFPLPCFATGLTGLEPATSGVTDRHSNQAELQPPVPTPLSIAPTGVEPVSAP